MQKIEILSPAGSLDILKTNYRFGADAVYLGGKAFNLRAHTSNFSNEELKVAVQYAHSINKKVYVTLNILAHDREIKALPKFIQYLDSLQVDAVIVADLGIIDLVQENSALPIHISTQASATNWRSVKMWQKLGAKRVVLAREISIDEIKRIKDSVPDMELEVFVHGSMCMTYSGRCNLSRYFNGRDSNRGSCTNACRWKYALVEERRPNEYFPVYEDETGSYIYNSKDLCSIEILDKILDTGVCSLKIEGRMKNHFYCANTTKNYRQALDSYLSGNFQYQAEWKIELEKMNHRGYTTGFFLGKLDQSSEQQKGYNFYTHRFAGVIKDKLEHNLFIVEIRERFNLNQAIEILRPNYNNITYTIPNMIDLKTGLNVDIAQPNMLVKAQFDIPVDAYDILLTPHLSEDITISTKDCLLHK